MIRYNELVIDGVHTSSFPFKVIVENSPPIVMKGSKTQLLEHRGISGAVMETNKHRNVMELTFKIYVVKPSEEELFQFLTLFSKEQFWLESEQLKTVQLWCYKVLVSKVIKDKHERPSNAILQNSLKIQIVSRSLKMVLCERRGRLWLFPN